MGMLKKGDYVLAAKYSDGDPRDQWCVGFYDGESRDRHFVVDRDGSSFRASGFRRVKKISAVRGKWLLDNSEGIELSGKSVWGWLLAPMQSKGVQI